jgi:hypothetical protein
VALSLFYTFSGELNTAPSLVGTNIVAFMFLLIRVARSGLTIESNSSAICLSTTTLDGESDSILELQGGFSFLRANGSRKIKRSFSISPYDLARSL